MLIKVTVYPESHEERVVATGGDMYEVYVRAGAHNGHANRVASALLAKHFNAGVRLVSGGTRRNKIFKIEKS